MESNWQEQQERLAYRDQEIRRLDMFACAALTGIMSRGGLEVCPKCGRHEAICVATYDYAEAMLKESRKRGKGEG